MNGGLGAAALISLFVFSINLFPFGQFLSYAKSYGSFHKGQDSSFAVFPDDGVHLLISKASIETHNKRPLLYSDTILGLPSALLTDLGHILKRKKTCTSLSRYGFV